MEREKKGRKLRGEILGRNLQRKNEGRRNETAEPITNLFINASKDFPYSEFLLWKENLFVSMNI